MTLLTEAQQVTIVEALDSRARVMAVRNQDLIDFWMQGRPAGSAPLVHYIESMEVVERRGDYELLRRTSPTHAVARNANDERGP